MQETAWQITLAGVGLIAAVYLFVWLRSGDWEDFGAVKRRLYRIRPVWFLVLVLAGGWASAATLDDLPYAATHGNADRPAEIRVRVTGHQWYWQIERTTLPADTPVAFEVRAADVNHSFAVYDDDGQVVAQTQAMPGYTNVLRHTFEEPGTYRVRCLEYCGLAHHNMASRLTVRPAEE
jgi:cytochrome c oxidase subunit 2